MSIRSRRRLPVTVQDVHQRKIRVTQRHPGTGVSHDQPYLFTHCRFEAVDPAVQACRLVVVIPALFDASLDITEKLVAIPAQVATVGSVATAAEDSNHGKNRSGFPQSPGRLH